jgi:dephospho-CoA kinase
MIIAVTGGIATGKSTVSRLLGRCLGADVLDADLLCRDLLIKGNPGWQDVQQVWGERFMNPQGEIDRILLRNTIFEDGKIRRELEQILHPLVRAEINSAAHRKKMAGEALLVEVPLLFEVGWQEDFDWTVTVFASADCCMQRIVSRDKVTEEDAGRILSAQMPSVCKAFLADSVIDNSGFFLHTCLQVYHLAGYLRKSYCFFRTGRFLPGENT